MRVFLPVLSLAAMLLTGCSKTNNHYLTYRVNSAASVAEWRGIAPTHFHLGSFQVKGSLSSTTDGQIKEGNFVIPISSIKNFDLSEGTREQLLTHLQSADFFNMALHPNAEFQIIKIDDYYGQAGAKVANKLVSGNLSMVGQTHMVQFPARIDYVGDSLKVYASFNIDRSKWGMTKYTDASALDYILPRAEIMLSVQASIK